MSNDLPEAYKIGWVPFLGTKIFLDSHPLIPRTETEWWVERLIKGLPSAGISAETLSSPSGSLRSVLAPIPPTADQAIGAVDVQHISQPRCLLFLDLFAGSGCCGVAVLKHIPESHVDFAELDARHLPTIKKNVAENADPARAAVYQSDVYNGIPADARYDYILANPPYLSQSRVDRVEHSVLHNEPHEALFAEDDGFALIARTIAEAPGHLAPSGQLWIEHEPEHSKRIRDAASAAGLSATVFQDQYGVERYSVILKS